MSKKQEKELLQKYIYDEMEKNIKIKKNKKPPKIVYESESKESEDSESDEEIIYRKKPKPKNKVVNKKEFPTHNKIAPVQEPPKYNIKWV
jgi:hypothetical protein